MAKRRSKGTPHAPHRSGGPFGVWITDGHEAEARAEETKKPPSRFGTFLLRKLGFKGPVEPNVPKHQAHPSHEHAVERHPEP